MTRAAVLVAALGLAACGDGPAAREGTGAPVRTVRQQEAEQHAVAATRTGWDRVFASPAETIGAINQAGFGLPAYAASGAAGAFRAEGRPHLMSRSSAPSPNMGNALVSGGRADMLDQISFTLALNDPEDAATARGRMADVLRDFLARQGLDDATDLIGAVRDGRAMRTEAAGLPVSLTATSNRLDVTFLRPGATAISASS